MILIWNRKSVYLGKAANIRELLAAKGVDYTWKVYNRSNKWLGKDGCGTVRSHFGSIGDKDPYEYEIFVHKKDYEKARYLIGQSK